MVGELLPIESLQTSVPPAATTVDVIADYAALLNVEAEWDAAVERAAIPHPFLRHEWIRTWWDAFGAGRRLHIVVVRVGGEITAIAPLMSEHVQMYGLPVRRLSFIANDHTPRADVILAGRPEESYCAIWDAVLDASDTWDVLRLNQVPVGSTTIDRVSGFAAASDCPTGVWHGESSPYLELTGTWESYWDGLPAKFRSNIRNRMKRLANVGDPTLEILSDRAAIEAASEEAWRLEASGWKREAGTAIASDPAVHRFYSLLTERGTAEGWLRLMFLNAGGRRIATSYGAQYANGLFLFKTGYDPEYAACAPFKLLTFLAIQYGFEEGLSEFDFLGQAEPWKLEWTPRTRRHDWLFVFSHSRRARLLHQLKFKVVPELKRWRA